MDYIFWWKMMKFKIQKIILIITIAFFLQTCIKEEKTERETPINRAEKLIKEEKYFSAYNLLKKNENKLKFESKYWLLLGNIALKTGKIDEAIKYYRKAISLETNAENKEKLNIELAYLYLISNYFENAKFIAEKILERDPDNLYANLILGRVDVLKGKKEEVKKRIKKIEKEKNISCEDKLEIGDLYLILNESQKALKNYEEARKICPNKIEPLLALSTFFFLKKDYELSEKYIKEAINIAKKRNIKKLEEQLINFLGEFYIKTNQTKKAEEIYKFLHKKLPENRFYTLRLAEIYLQDKNLKKAEELIKKNSKAKTFFIYYLMGHLNLLKGNYKEASLYFSQALSKEKNSRVYYYLALTQWLTGLEHQAIINFQKSTTLDPTFIQGKLLLTCILLKNKELKLAEEEIDKILSSTPKAHILKTALLLKKGECSKAQKELDFLKGIKIESFEKEIKDLSKVYQVFCLKKKTYLPQ